MDKVNLVSTFEMIGWSHPEANDYPRGAIKAIQDIVFDVNVYPEHLMLDPKKPPACVFIPEVKLLHTMIETIIKFDNKKDLLTMFCDMDSPPAPKFDSSLLFTSKGALTTEQLMNAQSDVLNK